MKKILIDTNSSFTISWVTNWLWSSDAQMWYHDPNTESYIYDALRIVQVANNESEIFEVNPALMWLDGNDDLTMESVHLHYYKDGIHLIPEGVPMPTESPKV